MIEPPRRGKSGRPKVSPFITPEAEERCYDSALRLVTLCYQPDESRESKPYVIPGQHALSARIFWALFYCYMLKHEVMVENQDYFCSQLRYRLPDEKMGVRRDGLSKAVTKLHTTQAGSTFDLALICYEDPVRMNRCKKYRQYYQIFFRLMDENF